MRIFCGFYFTLKSCFSLESQWDPFEFTLGYLLENAAESVVGNYCFRGLDHSLKFFNLDHESCLNNETEFTIICN